MPITSSGFELGPQLVHVVKDCVLAHHFEADVNVEQDSILLHDESSIKSWPNLDLVSFQIVGLGRVEGLPPDGFKLESSHE